MHGLQILYQNTDGLASGRRDPENDPADLISFADTPFGMPRADTRSDELLKDSALHDGDPIERDRATWELADRRGDKSTLAAFLEKRIAQAANRDEAISALWCAQKYLDNEASDFLLSYSGDKNIEIAEWAKMLRKEVLHDWGASPIERPIAWIPTEPFDQTLPLYIAGYACVQISESYYVRAMLSPLWFEEVFGRVMACTRQSDFDRNLIIEKKLSEYHPDGTDHYEIYRFGGFTFNLGNGVTEHIYESIATHTFYPSGKVEDLSLPPIGDAPVILNRKARPWTVPPKKIRQVYRDKNGGLVDAIKMASPLERVVDSVRGRFMGYAHVNAEKYMTKERRLGAGEAQLCSLHHPSTRELANVFVYGSFKSRLMDINGDGELDLNTIPAHATPQGELDYTLEGNPNPDPFDPFNIV